MTDGSGYKLRSEASVLGADELTDEQKQAGTQLHALLRQMVDSKDEVDKPAQSFLPRIDQERRAKQHQTTRSVLERGPR